MKFKKIDIKFNNKDFNYKKVNNGMIIKIFY